MSSNAFKSVMDIDVLGTFNTIKATLPYLVKSKGRIIYVSATFHYTGMPLQAHVSAAKASVDSIMASVSLEYGPKGVTSNVIAPGAIAGTEGMERLGGGASGEESTGLVKEIPSGRMGTVRDIADATVYLFSEAGTYVNGQALAVDGGAWRRQGAFILGSDASLQYPDFLIGEDKPKL
jgi:peroxisomal 2,4-dienoyl-CoA reductase